jgi:CheY-like chemotaxis protein
MMADRAGGKALHELGNLLAVIAGQAEFLLHQEPGVAADKTAEVLAIIRNAALRGREQLREVYALTRTLEVESAPPAPLAEATGLRVLLIDDDAAVRDAMGGLLRQAGHHVETAADAASGIACCDGERFDCILTDFTMPGMSGFAVSRLIKNKHPDVFVVLMTGADGPGDAALYRSAGVDRLLLKPCGREEILAAVASARRLAVSL